MVYFVYGITDCPACLHARAALMDADLEFVFIEADFAPTHRTQLKKDYKQSTFPIIVRKSEFETLVIGGYDDLCQHLERHTLNKNLTCPL